MILNKKSDFLNNIKITNLKYFVNKLNFEKSSGRSKEMNIISNTKTLRYIIIK